MKAVVGEVALPPEDKLALESLYRSEHKFVGQGAYEYRTIFEESYRRKPTGNTVRRTHPEDEAPDEGKLVDP